MAMGRAVIQSAVRRELSHFAYPFGKSGSFDARHMSMAKQGGFATAVSAMRGAIKADGRSNPYALPRINWDGRCSSLRVMRAVLAGMPLLAD
jgi:peptidoglycan/xylan/chitin deacetylase (PgdA/CDA1 family)